MQILCMLHVELVSCQPAPQYVERTALSFCSELRLFWRSFVKFCFLSLIVFKEDVFDISFSLEQLSQSSSDADSSKDSVVNVLRFWIVP